MSNFIIRKVDIPGLTVIESKIFTDNRGHFKEVYKESDFNKIIGKNLVQENQSFSRKGVLRGLHYQIEPKAQGKLVRCIQGEIFDVAVDIRPDSPTFKKWFGIILSKDNGKQLYIPEGFAHGFCVLSKEAEVVYKCTEEYSPEHERGIIWNDPAFKIDWPISHPILSEKDAKYERFKY